MSRTEPDGSDAAQESIRVETREQFDEAVEELFRTGMGKLHEKANEYHEQFAARIIQAIKEETAPVADKEGDRQWQKPWKLCGGSSCATDG